MSEATSAIRIGRARIDPCTLDEAIARILARATAGGRPEYVVTPNAHHVVMTADSPRFREVYDGAWLSLADGMSVVWAARLLGTPVPEKVSGSDLFPRLCEVAGPDVRIFLLGGREGAADEAARRLRERNPRLCIAGTYCPPMGFERDPAELERTIEAVRAARPHILFVGLGAPKQELFMAEHGDRLAVPVSIGVGVSFEFVAGMVQRAPRWVQNAGLEWLDRIRREPRRLWKRYATTNPRFISIVLRQYARERVRR